MLCVNNGNTYPNHCHPCLTTGESHHAAPLWPGPEDMVKPESSSGFWSVMSCFPFAGEGNTVLYLSGKQVPAVHTLHLSTPHPEYWLMFDAAPDHARVESISCLGLLDLWEEDIGQGRGLQLSRKELESCFMVLDFHKHLGLILGVTVPFVIVSAPGGDKFYCIRCSPLILQVPNYL